MIKWMFALICLVAPTPAHALNSVEPPSASAFEDEDGSAIAFRPPPGRATEFRKMLNHEIQMHPKNVIAFTHRAYFYIRTGNNDEAVRDFDHALQVADYGSALHRQVLWAYGWALYDLDRVEEALQAWRLCVKLHGGNPFWVPYSYSLAYWTAGERDAALAWYSTAVRSNAQWGNQAGVSERIARWRPHQKEQMQAMFDFWIAHQPN